MPEYLVGIRDEIGSEDQRVLVDGRAVDGAFETQDPLVELLIIADMGAADHALRAAAKIVLVGLTLSRGPADRSVVVAPAVTHLAADVESGPGEGGQRRRGRGDRKQPRGRRKPLIQLGAQRAHDREGRAIGAVEAARGAPDQGITIDLARVISPVEEIGDVQLRGHLRAGVAEAISGHQIHGAIGGDQGPDVRGVVDVIVYRPRAHVVVASADFPALQHRVALELIRAPEVRLIARHLRKPLADRGQRAAEGRYVVRRGLGDANIVIGVGGDHVPTGKDFALNIELRPRAARRPDQD